MNILNHQNRIKWAILAVFQNPQKKLVPTKYFLYEGENTIGSDQDQSDIVLNIDGISPLHAELYISSDGDAFISDQNSKYGVFKKASLNPNKKVKLEQNTRYNIIPDNEFYVGKYKCFIVAFDEDYKRGEQRRQREREEIQSQSQQRMSNNLTIDLDETDLDEAQNDDLFQDEQNQNNKQDDNKQKQLQMIQESQEKLQNQIKSNQDQYDKTIALSDKSESDNDVFHSKSKQNEQEYEKTLEIKSDEEDQEDLFQSKKSKNKQSDQYDKTLELSSGSEKEDEKNQLFGNKNKKNGNSQMNYDYEKTLELSDKNSDEENECLFNKKKNSKQMEYEKTLELSDKSDRDDGVFDQQKSNKNNNDYDQYEKTLEIRSNSSNDQEENNNNLFKASSKQNGDQFDKTLVLSDKEDQDNDIFSTQKKGGQISQNQRNSNEQMREAKNNNSYKYQTSQLRQSNQTSSNSKKMIDENKTPDLSEEENRKINEQNQQQQNVYNQRNKKTPSPNNLDNKMIEEKGSDQNKNKSVQQKNNHKEILGDTLIDDYSFYDDGCFMKENNSQDVNLRKPNKRQQNFLAQTSINSPYDSYSKQNKEQLSHNRKQATPNSQLAATLLDSPSENQSQNNFDQKSQNKKLSPVCLGATLIDTPNQSQMQSLNNIDQNIQSKKITSPLSPTLVDDETNSIQSQSKSNNSKSKKLKSPILLGTTYLEDKTGIQLIQSHNSQLKNTQMNQIRNSKNSPNQIELASTLVDDQDSKSRNLSPTQINSQDSQKNNGQQLQNTLIDSQQSQSSKQNIQQDNYLQQKILQQEQELKRLKEQLQNQNQEKKQEQSNKSDLNKIQHIKNISPYQYKQKQQQQVNNGQLNEQNQNNQIKQNNANENYKINVYSTSSEQENKGEKKNQNINLDKVNQFDDLFGNDDDDDENRNQNSRSFHSKEKSINENLNMNINERSSGKKDENSNGFDQQSNQQGQNKQDSNQNQNRSFGMLFKQKFPVRTLTMSDPKKILSPTTMISQTLPVTIEESDEQQKVSNTKLSPVVSSLPQKSLFTNSDNPSSDEGGIQQKNKRVSDLYKHKKVSNTLNEEVLNNNESSDDIQEFPKKKIKNQSWAQILKNRSGKVLDENSRNSTKSEESKDTQSTQQNTQRQTRQTTMIAEDADGNLIKDTLKIAVSGFKLRSDQKKGISQNLKCSLVENNEDFDVLVVTEVKRTIKFLLALMKKKPIVSEQWLNESIKKNQIIHNFNDYPPASDNFKERFKIELIQLVKKRKSIGQDNLIYEGNTFYISKNIADPSDEELSLLIEAGGGQIIKSIPKKASKKETNLVVILGQNDLSTYKTVQKQKSISCIITSEAILNASLNSEFEPDLFLIESTDFFKS